MKTNVNTNAHLVLSPVFKLNTFVSGKHQINLLKQQYLYHNLFDNPERTKLKSILHKQMLCILLVLSFEIKLLLLLFKTISDKAKCWC